MGKAQNYDENLCFNQFSDTSFTEKLSVKFKSISFFKNNEYFGDYVKGYTLPGAFVTPTLQYNSTKNTWFNIGLNALKYAGEKDFKQLNPVFSFNWEFAEKMKLTLGTFHAGFNHQLIEPIYSQEISYTNNISNGVQLLFDKQRFFADVWVDWEHFIDFGDTLQEKITGAAQLSYHFLNNETNLLSIDFQTLMHHRGGQINISDEPVQTIENDAFGIKYTYKNIAGLLKQIYFASYFTTYFNRSSVDEIYNQGQGLYIYSGIKTNQFSLMLSYWNSNKYLSSKGEAFYHNASMSPGVIVPISKQLINARIAYHKKITTGLHFETRLGLFYGVDNKSFNYNYGITLLFDKSFIW